MSTDGALVSTFIHTWQALLAVDLRVLLTICASFGLGAALEVTLAQRASIEQPGCPAVRLTHASRPRVHQVTHVSSLAGVGLANLEPHVGPVPFIA